MNSQERQRLFYWDVSQAVGAFLLAAVGIWIAVFQSSVVMAVCLIVLGDVYAFLLLLEAALRSIRGKRTTIELPHRLVALLLLPCLLVALISSFARLYTAVGEVCDSHGAILTSSLDATYFSAVTMTTVGYGDFVPSGSRAKTIVLCELGSGVVLLLAALPLVVSRLALFSYDPSLVIIVARDNATMTIGDGLAQRLPTVLALRDGVIHSVHVPRLEGHGAWECQIQATNGTIVITPVHTT